MENNVRVWFDKLSSDYATVYEHPTTIFNFEKIRRMELVVEHAQRFEPQSILDAGCGPGVVLSVLSRRSTGSRLVGTDLSYMMLQQAHANNSRPLSFVQSRVEQLPSADHSFDLVYALGVIDYLEKPHQFFKSVWRILKPGGYFIFTYPNGDSIHRNLYTWLRIHFRHFIRSRPRVFESPVTSVTVDRLIADCSFELLRRHFITYGNGLITFPWSVTMSQKLETWCDPKWIGRYLAWSCVCVVRKSTAPATVPMIQTTDQ